RDSPRGVRTNHVARRGERPSIPIVARASSGEALHRFQICLRELRSTRRLRDARPSACCDVQRIEIDELPNAIRIGRRELAQLRSGDRVSDEDGAPNVQTVEDRDVVARSRAQVVSTRGLTRATESAARDPDDAKAISELECKLIVDMRVV